jgi:hypothetical protein
LKKEKRQGERRGTEEKLGKGLGERVMVEAREKQGQL